jgi:carbamoyl-phosphate synthase large subunit
MEPGLYMDWLFERCYLMPYPSEGGDSLLQRLAAIQESVGLDCVIPNLDVELPVYLQCAPALDALGIRSFLPTREQFRLRAKERLPELAQAMDISVPATIALRSPNDLSAAAASLGFPLMVKGPFYKAYCVHSLEQAASRFHQLAAEWGYPILLQRCVSGSELNLVGVGDGEGGDFGLVAVKKVWLTELGKMWTAVTIDHGGLRAAARAFLVHYRWRGPFELECIASPDGRLHLIEINPRFPAWVYFATGVGVNLPAALVRAALGQSRAAPANYPAGKLFVRYTYEIVTDAVPMHELIANGERRRPAEGTGNLEGERHAASL